MRGKIADAGSLVLWSFFWLVNALFSMAATNAFGLYIAGGDYGQFWLFNWMGNVIAMPIVGFALHLLGSAIEGNAARQKEHPPSFWIAITYDIFTTTNGLKIIAQGLWEWGNEGWMWIPCLGLAIIFAVTPEPQIVYHFQRLQIGGGSSGRM